MTRKIEVVINQDWCKGCGICVSFCPKKVLQLNKNNKAVVVEPKNCIGCKLCELRCPDFAVEINFLDNGQG